MKRGFEEEEDDSDTLGRQALPVGQACEGEPLDGLAYLAQVRREASAPRFLVTVARDLSCAPAVAVAVAVSPVHAEPRRLEPLSPREAQWTLAFSGTFSGLRTRVLSAAEEAQLNTLRCGFRGVTAELCRAVFALAALLPDPLSPEAQSDLQFFARKLAAAPPTDACARVALMAVSCRVSIW